MGVPIFTNLDTYYADEAQWGQYQYSTLEELVNNFMYSQDNDSYGANIARNRVVYHAKRVVQELYYDVANEIISIELELKPSLIIALPHDYVSYVRMSWVDDCGKLHPMAVDTSHNLSQAYLQASNYDYLYDGTGDILQGSHIQDTVGCNPATPDYTVDDINSTVTPFWYESGPANVNMSKLFKNGSYRIDKLRGIIQFSSTVNTKIIVLEYISDGLFQRTDSQIRVHKFAEEAVNSYIHWMSIRMRRNVPQSEKQAARKDYFNFRRIAKRRIMPVRYEEVRQVLKGSSKNIKD
tara:strand:+ start:1706 stop:2587 length:882 start_codon:yes stop_codon:yes gene_type:complete